MNGKIRLSEKHGVNPSLDTCFFCGEPKGIALFGKLKGDAEAPRHVLLNYEPCEKCKAAMALGTTIIAVSETDNGNRPIQDKLYPTGSWCVMRKEAAKELFCTDADRLLLHEDIYERLVGGVKHD